MVFDLHSNFAFSYIFDIFRKYKGLCPELAKSSNSVAVLEKKIRSNVVPLA